MFDRWIIAPDGQPLNLDFVNKVVWGGNFKSATADQQAALYFFHGVAQVTGQKGSQTVLTFPTADAAQRALAKLQQLMLAGGATDLRPVPAAGAAQPGQTNTVPLAFAGATGAPTGSDGNTANANINGSILTLTGTGFARSQHGYLVNEANGVNVPLVFLSSTTLQTQFPVALPAASYDFDYDYTDAQGLLQMVPAAVTVAFS